MYFDFQLFVCRLGFVEVNYVAAFDEYEYEYLVGTSELGQSVSDSKDNKEGSNRDIIMRRAQHAQYVEYTEPDVM